MAIPGWRKRGGAKSAAAPSNGGRAKAKARMTVDEFFARELPVLSDLVTFCNNLPMSLYADSTGVKSPEVVFRGLTLSQNRLLTEEYLLNFRRSEADLGVVIGTNNYRLPMVVGALVNRALEEREDDLVSLPAYKNVRSPLGAVIRGRRSVRTYAGAPISFADLSTILFHGDGITGTLDVANLPETESLGTMNTLDLRAAVSGGALYPLDLYVVATNVVALAPGVYRYLPKGHALKPVGSLGQPPAVSGLGQFGEIEVDKASVLLLFAYTVFENARKYGESGLAFALMEAGAIATNVHLVCTALGIGSCDVGAFSKRNCERLIEADGIAQHVIHLVVIGK